jgi:nucleotide-binding universal stress UspA family protein
MRVLIGYDGSPSSGAIFEDLKRAGLPRDTKALVVTAADLFVDNPAISRYEVYSVASRRVEMVLKQAEARWRQALRETEYLADAAVERLRSQFPEWKIEKRVVTGTPAWELLDAANDFDADLIVVGSEGRSAIGRLILGSVSKKIATDARSSVRVARAPAFRDEDEAPRIIIGVDGSPAAEEAIYAVGRRNWPFGTEVRLIAVDDAASPVRIAARLPQTAAMIKNYFQSREKRVSAMLDWAVEEFKNIGLEASVLNEKGDPKTVLLEEARKWDADAVFVGTRDFKSAFERFRLGSVSTAIVTKAHCSVEIVRPGRQDESEE